MDPELTLWSIEQERKAVIARMRRARGAVPPARPVSQERAVRRAWFVRLLATSGARRTATRRTATKGGSRVHGL